MTTLDIDHLRGWIGRQDSGSETVSPALVEKFHATFDLKAPATAGAEAPLMIHLCLGQPAVPTSELGPDGHPARGGFLPPVPLPRRMWAGGAMEFHAPIRIGEEVTRRSTIRDVTVKTGRTGTLCFVTVDHEVTSDGRLAVTERQDIVYRDIGKTAAAATDQGLPQGDDFRKIAPSAALLFRYSALTFNGHRIHYDTPYTREEEGYPGLIVHGPMQATMLAQYAADLRGTRPKTFSFRSLSPLFDIADFTLNAEPLDQGLRLWTSYLGGPVAMEARADW